MFTGSAGCGGCHTLAAAGTTGTIGPNLGTSIVPSAKQAGMALKPATPIEPFEDLLPELDMILIMTVEPGFGGQKFLDVCLPKIRRARAAIDRRGDANAVWLQVDGGVTEETIGRCAEAGADMFVAGSAVFGSEDPAGRVQALREAAARPG